MKKEIPSLLVADEKGRIFDVPGMRATGMKSGLFFPLRARDLVKLHSDSELFMLPSRSAVGFSDDTGQMTEVATDPFSRKARRCYAVAAFMSPGYTLRYNASYVERKGAGHLPLFSYAAVAFYKGGFYAAGIRVDREKRQELGGMDRTGLCDGVKKMRRILPRNRLVRHLETCALTYGCPAAKNFFLNRYEAPLPSSPLCNARCIGCISHQEGGKCSVTQPRIKFVPDPEEIAEVALHHISRVADPVVSFGQGCEGEPLMVGDVLVRAVSLIRKGTSKGIININTNGSRPDMVSRLIDAGLDSIRVSVNSFQERYYNAYYRPVGYTFGDVMRSIRCMRKKRGFVSINYLVMPGFSDWIREEKALSRFLSGPGTDMIQWRNLNYDPIRYMNELGVAISSREMLGMDKVIGKIKKEYPSIMNGYFNPSLKRIRRKRKGGSTATL
ncbi:MAG: radical SAM protein [Candidatus Omnitrophica bacterium]|nr:radical SAM protein [Candidatus Omnitrophota bacterium]MDD5487506.1 radical SAM protein [Candidatus Omnitrophota bacterium]